MTEQPKHLKRGEAPRLLRNLYGSLSRDFSRAPSDPEVAAVVTPVMTIEDIRERYGLPAQLPDARIEKVIAEVVSGRAEAGPRDVVCIRTRDGKVMTHDPHPRPEHALTPERHRQREKEHVDEAAKALAVIVARRHRRLEPVHDRREADYVAVVTDGLWLPEMDRGRVLMQRGRITAAWKAVPE